MAGLFRKPFRLRLFLEQMEFVGVGSLPIICLVGFFSGAVSAQQAIAALRIFNQERFVGATVGLSLAQELAPVFTALMITARAGSGMATELGSMRITEQIDALTTFAVDPVQYLVTPRIVATVFDDADHDDGLQHRRPARRLLYSIFLEHIDLGQFIEQFTYWTDPKDYIIGATKAAVFGVTLSVAACYPGVPRPWRREGGGACHDAGCGCRLRLGSGVRLFLDRYLPHPLALSIVNVRNTPIRPAVVDPSAGGGELARRDERWQIRVRGLHKSFPPQHVLRGVDLDIERGRTNIIIGGSGQGKSVLMKHLMGLLKPDAGQIWVDGVDVVPFGDQEMGKLRRKYGMVFQYAALFDSMNVVENIAFPLLERYHLPTSEVMERVRDLLKRLDLENVGGIEQKFPPSCRAASASASVWRARSSTGRRSCSTTSRRPVSIRWPPRTSTR